MINVLISGCNGKMGQEVIKQIKSNINFNILSGFDRISDNNNNNFKTYTDIFEIHQIPDVIIDFSNPELTFKILEFAKKNNIPIVVATTGFTDEETFKILDYSKDIAIFKSANMSYEINLMADLVAKLALQLPNSDIEIIDTHHNNKIDSPSGTALLLADNINNALNNTMNYEYNRQAKKEKRNTKEIGIHSIRGGTVVGKHTVLFLGDNESFEITHTVDSRSIFVKGAIKAAEYIVNKSFGLYSMKDLIK